MRRLLFMLLACAALAATALVWTVRQAGRLPGWYEEARASGALEPDLVAAGRRAEQGLARRFGRELLDELTADDGVEDESLLDRVKRRGKLLVEGLRDGREVRMGARDLEALILARLADDAGGRELLAATRAVRVEIAGGKLEMGAVLRPRELPRERLDAEQRRLLASLDRLAGDEVYLAVRAVPGVVDERLHLGPPLRFQLGGLGMSSGLLIKLAGGGTAAFASGVPIDLGRVAVRQAKVDGDTLVLTISPEL